MPALPTAVLTDIPDAIRSGILADLPEIMDIEDEVLREQVIAAWALSLRDSPFNRISEIPGEGAPNHFVLRNGTQEVHLRGVVHLAMGVVDEFRRSSPGADVDRDIVLAGALCHDIGKCWECDPANQERWRARPDKVGYPSLRHSVYGAHICLAAGLPEAIAHIALGHSMEGAHIALSTECTIIRWADNSWWYTAAGSMMSPRPGGCEDFIRFVIPELQRRSRFRTAYEGKTLRENLGLKPHVNRYVAARADARLTSDKSVRSTYRQSCVRK